MEADPPATAEAVSVRAGHGQVARGGVRRGSRVLSPATDSEDSSDVRQVQYRRRDVRLLERPVLGSHSRR